ncbi:MAG: NADH-quinone oxidoreductase subunit B family protein [Thermoleophilia bacterium]
MLLLLRDLRRLRRQVAPGRRSRGGALQVRHVDAGSCNGCEHELQAAAGPHYDLARFGIGITASPRHADVLLVTGPVTARMRVPLLRAHEAMSEPRIVAALGACAVGGCAAFCHPGEIAGAVAEVLPVDVRIPGCPPTPDAIAAALIPLLDRRR